MRITSKVGGLAVAVAAALALAGCVQPPPHVIPTAAPSAAPVFKSDAAALAAAEKTYTGYLAASDAVAHDGGTGTKRLSPWVTTSEYSSDAKPFATMRANDYHTTGDSTFRDATLQSSVVSQRGKATVTVYLCLDISSTSLLDEKSRNVGADRPLLLPLVLTFVSATKDLKTLLVDRSDTWSGDDFCGPE